MPVNYICQCGHWDDDHITTECFNCSWEYDKYGKNTEKKKSTCPKYTQAYEAELGVIESVTLSTENHSVLTLSVCFDFGGSSQCYGDYCLDDYDKVKEERVGTAYGTECILRLLRYFGVSKLEEIKGKYVYALREKARATIQGIKRNQFEENENHDNEVFFSFKKIHEEFKNTVPQDGTQ